MYPFLNGIDADRDRRMLTSYYAAYVGLMISQLAGESTWGITVC
jgi:hypothetical protein